MATIQKSFLDYPGLQNYDQQLKNYSDQKDELLDERLTAVEGVLQGVDIQVVGNNLMIGYVYDKSGDLVDFTFSGSALLIG